MKNDLAISIIVAILGVVGAYFICNIFVGEITPVTVKSVSSSMGVDIAEPNPEVFNYKSINPTVEVYVGGNTNCVQIGPNGECFSSVNTNSPELPSDDQEDQ